MTPPRTFIGPREAADVLGVHENTIRNWEAKGILQAVRLPHSGYRRFDVEDIERMRREMFEKFPSLDEGSEFVPTRAPRGSFRHTDDD